MARQIKVSVIIPFYNEEQYIEECLKSAMNQREDNIEIICVNDGSADNSINIVRAYAKDDSRIHIINQENQGLSSARNVGISQARGEYLCFLDADDRLRTDAVSELYVGAVEQKADIVAFDGVCFFQTQELYDAKRETYYERSKCYGLKDGVQMFTEMRAKGDYCDSACLLFIDRQWLLETGITFYPGIYHEDTLFTLSCLMHSSRVLHINKSFYERRIRNGSITTISKTAKHLYGKLICHINCRRFVEETRLTEEQATALANFSRTMMREMGEILEILPKEEYAKLLDMPFTPAMRLALEQAGIAWEKTGKKPGEERPEGVKAVNVEKIVQMLIQDIEDKKKAVTPVAPAKKKSSGLLEKLIGKEKIIVVGCGDFGQKCYQLICDHMKDKVICFADNSYEKYPQGVRGKKVVSIEAAVKCSADAYFIVTPKYHFMEIIKQLNSLGVSLEQINCWLGY